LAQAPDIPTFREFGLPSVAHSTWAALFAPKNVPQAIIGKLNAAVVEALADEALRTRLVDLGYEVYPRERQTPEALGALRKADGGRSSRSLGSSQTGRALGFVPWGRGRRPTDAGYSRAKDYLAMESVLA